MLEKSSGTVKILDCLKSKALWSYMSTLNFKVPPPCQSSPKMLEYACVCQKTAAKSRKSPNLPVRFPKSLAAVYAVLMSRNLSDDYKWKKKLVLVIIWMLNSKEKFIPALIHLVLISCATFMKLLHVSENVGNLSRSDSTCSSTDTNYNKVSIKSDFSNTTILLITCIKINPIVFTVL